MKKIIMIVLIGTCFSGYSNGIRAKKILKKNQTVEIDCDKVYVDTRNAALKQGFTIGPAQQIGLAAYYSCKNSNRKSVSIE